MITGIAIIAGAVIVLAGLVGAGFLVNGILKANRQLVDQGRSLMTTMLALSDDNRAAKQQAIRQLQAGSIPPDSAMQNPQLRTAIARQMMERFKMTSGEGERTPKPDMSQGGVTVSKAPEPLNTQWPTDEKE